MTWGDVLREMDVALFCADTRWRRERGGKGKLVVDWGRCKAWMRGVVFLDKGEKKVLDSGLWIGKKGLVMGSVG